jgi:transposase
MRGLSFAAPTGLPVRCGLHQKRKGPRTMAIIPQGRLFSWEDVDNLGDLQRLKLVLETMPDEPLMRALEAGRGRGRDDYPVRAVWNSVLAVVVHQNKSVEEFRRELARNGQLREICGFDPVKPAQEAVPPPWAYTRFLKNLMSHQEEVDAIFDSLVESLKEELPDLGEHLACDSKGIESHARPMGKDKQRELGPDGRRDRDADFGHKTQKGTREDGTLWEKVVKWFGYKLHLLVDADYELPVGYKVTRASAADGKQAPGLLEDLESKHGELIERAKSFIADKGYDDSALHNRPWQTYGIAPIIPRRQDWKDGEATRPLLEGADNIVYDIRGRLHCYAPGDGRVRGERRLRAMAYWGFEKERDAQKWRCPAAVHKRKCRGREDCCAGAYGRLVRVERTKDVRIFCPVAPSSLKWERLYKKRTAVERVNSRLDVSGFEEHFIRGLAKMRLRCSLALVVMLAMALGRVRQKRRELMRSLVAA